MTKVTAESMHKIVIPDFNILVSVDMRVLKSGRLCGPGQHSLGGVLMSALPSMTILAQVIDVVLYSSALAWPKTTQCAFP